MKWQLFVTLSCCCLLFDESQAQSGGFFGALANIFRRGSSSTTAGPPTIDFSVLDPATLYVTAYSTLTQTETETMTVTETDTSTMSLSWLRWTTETEREFITETVTTTSTSVDVSLLVSVAVVTLTERSTSFMTTTTTVMSATTRTIYSDLVFTEPAPQCPTYTVTVQAHKPYDAIEIDIDDMKIGERSQAMAKVDIDDLDLVEGFLSRTGGSLIGDSTATQRLPHLMKHSSHIDSSFSAQQRYFYPTATQYSATPQSMVTANLMFSN